MRASEPQWAWQISQVQQLVGLQRRDIQRACYRGDGGVGILDPQDSSWGRRHYEIEDLAKLFIVRQCKNAGHSLPEIAGLLEEERRQGHDTPALLETQATRLLKRCCDAFDQLVRAQALLMAVSNAGDELPRFVGELARLVGCAEPEAFLAALKEAARCMHAGTAPDDRPVRQAIRDAASALGPYGSVFGQGLRYHGWPARPHGQQCTASAGEAPKEEKAVTSPEPRTPGMPQPSCRMTPGNAGRAPANARPAAGPSDRGATTAATCDGSNTLEHTEALRAFFDLPGIDLALELWLGAGSFDYLCKAAACIDVRPRT